MNVPVVENVEHLVLVIEVKNQNENEPLHIKLAIQNTQHKHVRNV